MQRTIALNKLRNFYQKIGDISGMWGGFICLLHCLAVPLAGLVPALGGIAVISLHNHMLDLVFIFISTAAVLLALRHTHRLWVRLIMVLGLLLFVSGTLLHEDWPWMLIPASAGSVLLIIAHSSNLALRARQRTCPVPQA
ncbi:MAG: MerC domain-containing protein [Bacteroidetes bacterium]|nr:MerC domain-containing protein [Bacteroidota bacterium]